jgi:DNA-binding NtrC family response regulator
VSLFVERCNREFGTSVRFISRRAMERLLVYGWPGNVRELEHAIRCALLLSDSDRIDLENLPGDVLAARLPSKRVAETAAPSLPQSIGTGPAPVSPPVRYAPASLRELTRDALVSALSHARGNRQRAARILGVSRTTLYRMLMRYGLEGFGREDDRADDRADGREDNYDGFGLRSAGLRLVKA